MKPILKWPGGKSWASGWIVEQVLAHAKPSCYIEPFIGGGAVFFRLEPSTGIISDTNEELVNVYRQVRDNPEGLVRILSRFTACRDEYYRIRGNRSARSLRRAAEMLYLNRTCFGGIYRVNSKGIFNVPFGGGERDHSVLYKTDLLFRASDVLRDVDIQCCDFSISMKAAGEGDVVFCDPAYVSSAKTEGFARYTSNQFSWNDQVRLAAEVKAAHSRGAIVIVSNIDDSFVRKLYRPLKPVIKTRYSGVSRALAGRGSVSEAFYIF